MSFNKTMIRSGATAVLGAAALAGCASHAPMGPVALTPTEQYGVQVTSAPEQIALGLHPAGLTVTQQAALGQFVSRWRDNGGGPVSVRAPVDAADPGSARRMQAQAAAYIVKLGVPAESLQVSGYVSNRAPGAPLLASYDRFEARGPNCSGAWGSLTTTGGNRVYDHFGCSLSANVAVQVANPRDFLAPAVETPADDGRREIVLDKYRKGEVTSSAKDDQANGKVSDSSPQ